MDEAYDAGLEQVSFRPVTLIDIEGVLAIEHRAFSHPWTEQIFRDCLRAGYTLWLGEGVQGIECYGVLSVAAGEGHILNITVRPESQGRGLGTRMLEQLIRLATRRGAGRLFLEVRVSNPAAIALYARRGFSEIGRRKGYYPGDDGREDAIVMELQLEV